ncbi:hypothetical protein [Streptomyces tropicalis]|uniref:Uncharacterized protein n=1 Tax=Streptomyces tropicalis TaxID=3034234 RepID=A0ABT6AD94_9ACTN|nr:hypothetical protein [Streptomyces tropicalis]MDF3302604.1 hypothetical protein [Streptomyces tropicalis]
MTVPIVRRGAALGLSALWWWAVLRLALSDDVGVLEGVVAAGGWGLSLLPVHCVPKAGARPARGIRIPGGGPGAQDEPGVPAGAVEPAGAYGIPDGVQRGGEEACAGAPGAAAGTPPGAQRDHGMPPVQPEGSGDSFVEGRGWPYGGGDRSLSAEDGGWPYGGAGAAPGREDGDGGGTGRCGESGSPGAPGESGENGESGWDGGADGRGGRDRV